MEFLINPNLAYLLLVAGIMLAILAIFSPGTGMLEIGALFVLLLAGWEIYNLPINIWALILLALGILPFILAVLRSKRIAYLIGAEIAFIIGSCFLFRGDAWWKPAVNPFLAIIISVMAGGYLWLAATKVLEMESRQPSHNLASLVGAVGETRTDVHETGSVQIAGELWSARSSAPIPQNTKIQVLRREGFVLVVEVVQPVSTSQNDIGESL